MTCHECDSEVAENDVFCPYCGISLEPVAMPDAKTDDSMASTVMIQNVPADQISSLPGPPEPAMSIQPEAEENSMPPSIPEPVSAKFEEEVPEPALLKRLGQTERGKTPVETPSTETEVTLETEAAELDQEVHPASVEFVPRTSAETVSKDAEMEFGANEPQNTLEPVYVPAGSGIIDSEPSDNELFLERKADEVGISKPLEELEHSDPYLSNAAFDSVRIIENRDRIRPDDVDTRIQRPLPETQAESAPPDVLPIADVQGKTSKEPLSPTTPNITIGETDGKRGVKLKPLPEGAVLNSRYEIVRKIGGGGMGAVYLASDNNLGGVLRAVKEMVQAHIEEAQQEKAIDDFRRESTILSSLDHVSIPTIYDYFYDEKESRFYLVMKYISGGDLSSRLKSSSEGRIDERTVTEWSIQITDVLDYLHNQPSTIVYRDLKPSNIMIDGNSSRVMLIDFGIARSINQKEEKGVTAVGTMGYAPPELFSGNVEPRSDIYSLGSTMFHLLTGADPQSNPLLIFDFQKNPRPRQINSQLSDQMEHILMRAVEYNAEARFRSAAEMRAVLEAHREALRSGNVTYGITEIPESVSLSNQSVFCGFCGQRIVATDLFCAFCGAKQPIAQQGVHSEIYSKGGLTARLVIEGTSELNAPVFSLQKDENLLGRRDPMSNIFPEIDLSKYDPQTKISRRHARIWRDGGKFMVEDLGSSNGTILARSVSDNIRLIPNQPQVLAAGDKIKVGDATLHFVIG